MFPDSKVHLCTGFDVVEARQYARRLARELGFGLNDQARIATAVSEVATRAVGNQGTICFSRVNRDSRQGLECACEGCEWPPASGGRSFAYGAGGILGGAERLMDDFEVSSGDDRSVVVMRKWLPLTAF